MDSQRRKEKVIAGKIAVNTIQKFVNILGHSKLCQGEVFNKSCNLLIILCTQDDFAERL